MRRFRSEADAHVRLAEADSHRPHLEPPLPQPLGVGREPGRDALELTVNLHLHVPEPLREYAGSLHDLLVEGVLVAEFVPHAGLAADDVDAGDAGLVGVHFAPVFVDAVDVAVHVVEADVEVGEVVVAEDDLVLAADHAVDVGADSPPVDHVVVLQREVDVLVGPVDHLLAAGDVAPHLLLLLAVVDCQRGVVRHVVGRHPVQDALPLPPALERHLVAPEVHVLLVLERRVHVLHHLRDHLPGQRDRRVELAHVEPVAVQRDLRVLLAPSPGLRVRRRVDLGDHADAPESRVVDDCLDVRRGEEAPDAAVLAELGHRGHLHGEGVLVDDVPVEHVQLRVEHRVHGPQDRLQRQVVPRGVDHQPAPLEGGRVPHGNREAGDLVAARSPPLQQLREGLEGPQEPGVKVGSELPLPVAAQLEGVDLVADVGGDEQRGVGDCDSEGDVRGLAEEPALEDLGEIPVDDLSYLCVGGGVDEVFDVAGTDGHSFPLGGGGEVARLGPEQVSGVGCSGEGEHRQEQQELFHHRIIISPITPAKDSPASTTIPTAPLPFRQRPAGLYSYFDGGHQKYRDHRRQRGHRP